MGLNAFRNDKHSVNNGGCTQPDAVQIIACVRMKTFMSSPVSKVLKDMELLAEEQDLVLS